MSNDRKVIADFEILRREDFPPVVTMNANLLPQSPRKIRVSGTGIEILGLEDEHLGWLEDLPPDVLAAANSDVGLLIVEMAESGPKSAQNLRNTAAR